MRLKNYTNKPALARALISHGNPEREPCIIQFSPTRASKRGRAISHKKRQQQQRREPGTIPRLSGPWAHRKSTKQPSTKDRERERETGTQSEKRSRGAETIRQARAARQFRIAWHNRTSNSVPSRLYSPRCPRAFFSPSLGYVILGFPSFRFFFFK